MNKIKLIFLTLVISFTFSLNVNSKPVPASFADLAEKLMPSVVNISTTTTITTNANPFPFQFPPRRKLKRKRIGICCDSGCCRNVYNRWH